MPAYEEPPVLPGGSFFVSGLFSRTCPVRMGPGRYEGGNRMASVKEEKKTLVGEEIIREILAQMGI